MPISFNGIPNVLLTPGAYIENDSSRAVEGLADLPLRILVIGGRLSTGSIPVNTLARVLSKDDGPAMFGRGSQLALMLAKLKNVNKFAEVFAIGQTTSGTAATKTITVTGPATSDGTLHFLVNGNKVDVAVLNGTAQNDIATAIDTAFALYEADWMYTFAVATNVVTGTSRHGAAFSSDFDIQLNYYDREELDMPAGVTVTIAAGVAGATDPDVTAALAAIGDEWFTDIVLGYNLDANMDIVEAELEDNFGPMLQKDGRVWVGHRGSHANHLTYGDSRNSPFSLVIPTGSNSPHSPWEWAAAFCGVSATEPDPIRPRQNMKVAGILPPPRESVYTREERNLLLDGGISTWITDKSGALYIERLVTTYQTNAQSVDDTTFMNLETMLGLMAIRYTTRARIQLKYPRHKLADDNANYGPGQAVVTPKVIRGEMISLFREWEQRAWVEGFDQFKAELIVERNADDRDRLDVRFGPNLVNQFRVFAGQNQFIV